MARRILWGCLALTPVAILARFVFDLDETTLFILAAAALIPLAWLIGEATEHAAEHTGPGVGGFLNASFGNAPELIIALFAVARRPADRRARLAHRLGRLEHPARARRGDDRGWRRQGRRALAALAAAGRVRRRRADLDPVGARAGAAVRTSGTRSTSSLCRSPSSCSLRTWYHRAEPANPPRDGTRGAAPTAWSLQRSLVVLGVATAATALVSEILVHSLDHFGKAVGLNEFFIAVVIVAIVGNAAEHGGAVVIARRGNTTLATEIAITSSMQVAVFVAPVVCLLSWIVGRGLPLSFRVIEIVTMAAAALFAAIVVADGRSRRWEGFLLVGVYGAVVVWYLLA